MAALAISAKEERFWPCAPTFTSVKSLGLRSSFQITIKFPDEAGGRLRTRVVAIWRNTRLEPTVRSLPTGCGVLFKETGMQEQLQTAIAVLREKGLLVEEEPPEEGID